MAQLVFNPTYQGWWEGTVTINYVSVYDPKTNRTTVTFSESIVRYLGRSQYGSSSATTITVTANDNPSSKGQASFTTQGATNGGQKNFYGTPSPTTIVVQHSNAAGDKSVTIAANTSITCYPASTSQYNTTISGSGSASVVTGKRKNQGLVAIDSELAFQAYIDNGSELALYQAYEDNGSDWDACGT